MNDLTIFIAGIGVGVFVVLMIMTWFINAFTSAIVSLGTAAITTENAAKKVDKPESNE